MADQLPLEFQPHPLSPEERAISALLRSRRGRASALSVPEVAAHVELDERVVQDVVKHLIEEHQQPIGTATKRPFGYYWIVTNEERTETRDSLMRRALSTLRRARAYDTGRFVAGLVGQIEMDLNRRREPGSGTQ